jgi:hypothetical protein
MAPSKTRNVGILDIRRDKLEESLLQTIIQGLSPENGSARSMPTLLLYDGTLPYVNPELPLTKE